MPRTYTIDSIVDDEGLYRGRVVCSKQGAIYHSTGHKFSGSEREEASEWLNWMLLAPRGNISSVYYILGVPINWAGPGLNRHRYSGLHFKIGTAKNVLKRFQDLKTGSAEELFLHALEPGGKAREAEIHRRFDVDRRQGEWFIASPDLTQHVTDVFAANRVMPPVHVDRLFELKRRIALLSLLRDADFKFDVINPSLNEDWGQVNLIDGTNPLVMRDD